MDNTEYFSQFNDEERWETLRAYYQQSEKANRSLTILAKECNSRWFDNRPNDTPEDFIQYSWYQLINRRGFGKKKLQLLLEILISNVDLGAPGARAPKQNEAPDEPAIEIDGWDRFPLLLSFFKARTKAVFESASVQTPNELVEWYERIGDGGVLSFANSGRKTLTEIKQIYRGWRKGELSLLQQLLPVDKDGRFTLQNCVLGHYYALTEENQKVLTLRLVESNTLEACGKALNKTRERVRQIERLLLQSVDEALDYFKEEKEKLFEQWRDNGSISDGSDLEPADQNIFRSAITASFERSSEGKDAIAENAQTIDALVDEIRELWSYYCDGLPLDSFLNEKGITAHKDAVIDSGTSKGYFAYDKANDLLRPTKALQKHAALTCLKCSDQSEWSGAEWLLKLKESERFAEVDLPHLKHLYSNWKKDPAFQEFGISFTGGEIEIIEELERSAEYENGDTDAATTDTTENKKEEASADRLEVIRRTVSRAKQTKTQETPTEENLKAKELDLRLRSIIEEAQSLSSEDALLGFLNITDDEQEEILALAREELTHRNAATFIRKYPALATYALTLAAAVGLKDDSVGSSSFYRAWEASIGWSPAVSSRKRIAQVYISALKHLDLRVQSIFTDHPLDWKGGCYLFHAAVLPHFISPLEAALKSVQRELPLPDPDEPQQIDEFARLLASRVEQGQKRLIAVLQSPVGALLVRRLVLWHMTGDPDLFPPFILTMLEEQKSAGQETIIKRPYIVFDVQEEELFLELPAQSGKITNAKSKWIVNGRTYRADAIREPIRLSEILTPESDAITVEIEGLLRRSRRGSSELRKQSYTFSTGFTPEQPFRIFREVDGREFRFQTRHGQIELPLGCKYLALLDDEVGIESEHLGEQCELGQFVEFDMNIDSPALSLNDGETEWTIKPKINPGAFVHRKDALSFKARDLIEDKDVSINYGADFGLTIALPSGAGTGTVTFESKTSTGGLLNTELAAAEPEDHLTLIDVSAEFTGWLAGLPPAIHEIEIIVTPVGRKHFRQAFWYWKGLSYVSQSGDMYCENFPNNIELKGYQKTDNRLEFVSGGTQRAEFYSKEDSSRKDFRLRIPKPGVDITISSNEGEVLETNPTQAIDILPSDARTITFHHGGLAPIELTTAGSLIGKIDAERSSVTRSIGALAANHGKTGTIEARALIPLIEQPAKEIIRWRTPKVFNRCLAAENEEGEYHWDLTGLPSVGLQGIRVRLYNLEARPTQPEADRIVEIDLPEHHEHVTETSIIEGISVETSLSFKGTYRFIFNHDRHTTAGQVHVIEMDCMIVDSGGWQQLACNEGHNRLSDLRLIFKGHQPETVDESNLVHHVFWYDLSAIGFGLTLDMNIPEPKVVENWLSTARWLVNYRYPRTVWEKYNFRLKALYHSVTRLAVTNHGSSYWWKNAAAGLEEHAERKTLTATVAPCLLFAAAYTGSFPKLEPATKPFLKDGGLIARSFSEASLVVGARDGALGYVQSAFQDDRIDPEFLGNFSTWQQLLKMNDVPLKGFSILDWSSGIAEKIRHASFEDLNDEFRLLDSDHYLACIRKLSERAATMESIRSQETSHWLSPHISKLIQLGYRATDLLRQITGKPHEELWEPFESSEILLLEEELRSLVISIIKSSSVLAAAYASVNKGMVAPERVLEILEHEFGKDPNRAETLRFLIIGAAPELIAYFLLYFTFTL